MDTLFKDKVALVTGGSRGIGAAVATRLAQQGATVAVTYTRSPDAARSVVKTITAAGGRALALRADNGSPEEVRSAVNTTARTFGGLDILVNNAGIGAAAQLESMTVSDLDRIYEVNVRGTFVATQEAARHLPPGGRVIITGSVFADRSPFAGQSGYVMTKAALAGLNRALARDLAPRQITVNLIQPGAVDTDLNPADGPAAAVMRSATPLGRYGTPDEIAGLIAYLASPDAAFITGATLNADGGFTT
ncbi:SDR family NAD(P)-dependent oxidoreductase [Streptomyces sp. NBC_00568]|uniref:SDR family NAD(P)-dependent oxidoreductase n=1 Tax=Streptomyces sp. NBC_00568 TaxID=2975779 RepID=UPI002258F4A5|nr:3-oxoacyl-ACP reductase family protein [Streptomyces sp. NBC_00568]MCX4993593.1 3-oxoacyl-ACP reductase FabG [Streptomyces sp. NBC_00568]